MTDEERSAREAELNEQVRAADKVVVAAEEYQQNKTPDERKAWWQQLADAHTALMEAYDAAIRSGLWPVDSLMWMALGEASWHNKHEADRAQREADRSERERAS